MKLYLKANGHMYFTSEENNINISKENVHKKMQNIKSVWNMEHRENNKSNCCSHISLALTKKQTHNSLFSYNT